MKNDLPNSYQAYPNQVPFDTQCIENVKKRLKWQSKDRVINPIHYRPEVSLVTDSYTRFGKDDFLRFNSYPKKKTMFGKSMFYLKRNLGIF